MADETKEPAVPAAAATGTEKRTTIYCGACGAANPAGNRFCGECGHRLGAPVEDEEPEAVESPAPPVPAAPAVTAIASVVPPAPAAPAIPVAPVIPQTPAAVSPAVTTRPAPPLPAVPPSTPLDAMSRERERDRLLTLANVQRMRGQIDDARRTLTQAIGLSDGMPNRAIAPAYELLGDLYAAEEKWEDARQAFGKAQELDTERVSAEKKFATMTLKVASGPEGDAIANAMLRGDSIADLLSAGSGRKRNAGMAMFLSFVPGFGQFYNGQFVKGAILLGVWVVCMLIIVLSPDHDVFLKSIVKTFAMKPASNFPALPSFAAVVSVAISLYSIVDAPFMANRVAQGPDAAPKIDKTGWEV